ncbi:MAG: ABC transporter ATP-binding protein, partial [Spirochaetaceae bacterium]|nr:ABC transporter ATP-binding protein [Spirochaetaceae bacterium]
MEKTGFPILLKNVNFYYEEDKYIFKDLNLELPKGVVSLIGQNGTGKSTFLLLASGRLIPQKGTVHVLGAESSNINSEIEKNKLVSFIYQNMEFETEDLIGELLTVIYKNGLHKEKNPQLIKTIIDVMDLNPILNKKTGEISKGELQRTVLAFSLLYGSKIIMMEEPVFALENYRKEIIFAYLNEYAKQFDVSIYFSIHELNLSEKYSKNVLLFTKDGKILSGLTNELLKKEIIENAFQVPLDMLY